MAIKHLWENIGKPNAHVFQSSGQNVQITQVHRNSYVICMVCGASCFHRRDWSRAVPFSAFLPHATLNPYFAKVWLLAAAWHLLARRKAHCCLDFNMLS